jgi:hypothetical protein
MPHYKLTQQLNEKARRIREVHSAFRRERVEHVQRIEDASDIRRALQSNSASEFLFVEVL